MTGMMRYYLSRAVLFAAFGIFLAFTGSSWWMAALFGILAFAFFLWAPHSGRYAVHPELGVTALRRDERTQAINDRSARNAFVISMLAVAGIALYLGVLLPAVVRCVTNSFACSRILTYYLSDFLQRRST
jgi:hypothetical protein